MRKVGGGSGRGGGGPGARKNPSAPAASGWVAAGASGMEGNAGRGAPVDGWVDGGAPRPAMGIQWVQLCRLPCQLLAPAKTARIGRTMRMKLRKAITSIRLGRLS